MTLRLLLAVDLRAPLRQDGAELAQGGVVGSDGGSLLLG
jgi:hypothetical protein